MFFSCQKVQENKEEAIPETKEQTVSFNALPMGETKTAFTDPSDGKYPTLWTANDEKIKISMNYGSAKDATVTPSKDFTKATFAAEFTPGEASEFTFYALSPASSFVSVSGDPNYSLLVNIPTSQTPITKSVDEAAQILFAKSATLNAFPTESVDLQFSHLTAYACMSLKNLDLGGATINSISITAGANIAGRWYYYPGTGALSENSASATITVNTTSATDVMFALAPVDLAGKTLKIVVNTNMGTFTKDIASWPSGKAFLAGHVAKFALSMEGITVVSPKVYTLVKDVAELTAGSKVIIAAAESNFAISTTQNGNNRANAAVTISDEKISSPSESIEIFTVEAGTKDNTYAFHTTNSDAVDSNDGYIYAASSGSNYMRTEASKSDNSSFAISIDANGIATVVAQGTNTRNHMRHNSSSSCFSCYAESSSVAEKVAIYKLAGSGSPAVVTPVINITSSNPMEIANTASSQTIEYSISNPTEASLTAALQDPADTWISNIDYGTDGQVSFDVAAQEGGAAARSAVIVLSYTGADDVEVTVNQAAGAGASYDFETIAALNALVTSTSSTYNGYLTDAVVSYVPNTGTAIIKDATGSITYYKSGHGLKQGQTFTGEIQVTAIQYNSLYSEITAMNASFTGSETVVDPEDVALSALVGNYATYQNAYVRVAALTVTEVSGKNITVTDGVNSYVVYCNYGNATNSVNDVITAVGTVTKYSSTEEIKVWKADNIVTGSATPKAVTFTQPTEPGCSFTVKVGGATIASGDTVESGETVTLTATAGSGYTFSGWTVTGASVANASASETTFTMGDSDVSISAAFSVSGGGGPTVVSVSVSDYASANSWSNDTKYTSMSLDANVTATITGGGNSGKYYTSGDEWRLYQTENASITINAGTKTITSVTITYSVKNTGTLKKDATVIASGAAQTPNASSVTYTVGNTGSATNGQVKITAISVTYE